MEFAPGVKRWAALPVVAGVVGGFLYWPLAAVGLLVATGVVLFFRDPERTPAGEGVLAPADGRVTVLSEQDDRVRVGVFMNVTDVHVNRAPVAGEVRSVGHEPGGHWPAFSKGSERNERRRYWIESTDGDGDTEVVQIAGTLARRTHAYVAPGEDVARGERLGHIAFGSRVDVRLPPAYGLADLAVAEGDRVRAGETVPAADDP
jgi:phosphatidylserine decarboxylase